MYCVLQAQGNPCWHQKYLGLAQYQTILVLLFGYESQDFYHGTSEIRWYQWWWWWWWRSKKVLKKRRGQARSQVLSNRVRSEVAFFKGFSFFLNFFLALTFFAFLAISFLAGANGWVCKEYWPHLRIVMVMKLKRIVAMMMMMMVLMVMIMVSEYGDVGYVETCSLGANHHHHHL